MASEPPHLFHPAPEKESGLHARLFLMLRTLPLVVLASLALGLPAFSGTVAESQADWHKKYKKQENAPDPAKMLLNTDPEPNLTKGFTAALSRFSFAPQLNDRHQKSLR